MCGQIDGSSSVLVLEAGCRTGGLADCRSGRVVEWWSGEVGDWWIYFRYEGADPPRASIGNATPTIAYIPEAILYS